MTSQKYEDRIVQVISFAGMARSLYIEAIDLANDFRFDGAMPKIEQGQGVHIQIIQGEIESEGCSTSLLLCHAEDQLMSAESFNIIASKFVDLNRRGSHEKTA